MIEVDGIRRAYSTGNHFGPYSQGVHPQLPAHIGTQPLDPHPGLIHWNRSPNTGSTGTRTDDEDEDDEDRPFTPPPPRERLSYTRYQLELLNAIYIEVRYPNSTQKQLIAKRVGITREQVKIWFQNRRRKDVVGNSGKNKACDTSTSSAGSTGSKDPEVESPSQTESESNSSSDDASPAKETEESVVPDVVMKSVISELLKFVNDPLKGKKNKKKSRTKKKDKGAVKKGLSATLLACSYDMVSPPNEVTPSAFFEKMKSGFNHSKSSSAFESPREGIKPPQIGQISSSTEISSEGKSKSQVNNFHSNGRIDSGRPLQERRGHFSHGCFNGALPAHSGSHSLEIPVMSDILSYKSGLEARHKEIMSSASSSHVTSSVPHLTHPQRTVSDRNNPFSHLNNFTSGRPINGIYPFPFLAEQPMLLSSLRQQDHVFRPSPHYPFPHLGGEDPYQPLLISSLNNPYYSPQTTSWPSSTLQNPSLYTQL